MAKVYRGSKRARVVQDQGLPLKRCQRILPKTQTKPEVCFLDASKPISEFSPFFTLRAT